MNKARRKAIEKLINDLNYMREKLGSLIGEEQDYLDNIPDRFTEKRERVEEILDCLTGAEELMLDVDTSLLQAIES